MHIAYSLFEEIKQFDKFHEEKLLVDTFLFFTIVKFPDNSLIFLNFEIPWFFPAGNLFWPFSLFSLISRLRGHPVQATCISTKGRCFMFLYLQTINVYLQFTN